MNCLLRKSSLLFEYALGDTGVKLVEVSSLFRELDEEKVVFIELEIAKF